MPAVVLATLLRGIERAFGGLDRVALWHRHTAVAAVILMVIHPVLRAPYSCQTLPQRVSGLLMSP